MNPAAAAAAFTAPLVVTPGASYISSPPPSTRAQTPRRPSSSSPSPSHSYSFSVCPSRRRSPMMTIATSPTPSPPPSSSPRPPKPTSAPTSASSADTAPVTELDGVDAYLDLLDSHRGSDALIVLKVYAPWCRSCKALTPKVNRLAREHADVTFVSMNYEANKELCRRLGVYSMPTFIMYCGAAGEIDKFTCGPQRSYILTRKIRDVQRGFCVLDENRDKQVQQPAYGKKKKDGGGEGGGGGGQERKLQLEQQLAEIRQIREEIKQGQQQEREQGQGQGQTPTQEGVQG